MPATSISSLQNVGCVNVQQPPLSWVKVVHNKREASLSVSVYTFLSFHQSGCKTKVQQERKMEHYEVTLRRKTRTVIMTMQLDELRKRDEGNTTAKSASPLTLHSTTWANWNEIITFPKRVKKWPEAVLYRETKELSEVIPSCYEFFDM